MKHCTKILNLTLVLILVLAAVPGLCAARAETFYARQIDFCNEYVNLRAKPDSSSRSLDKVYIGEVVMAAPYNGEFSYCCYNSQYGYIRSEYLSSDIQPWSEGTFRVANCKQSISLRAMPTTKSDAKLQIPLGATLEQVYYHDGGYTPGAFAYVKYNGEYGFALWDYLESVWVPGGQ